MSDRIEYVQARRGDVATLAEFRVAMFKDMFPDEDWKTKAGDLSEASFAYYERQIESSDQYACIAQIEGKSVGSGCIMFQERAPHHLRLRNLCGYILSIYVLPEHRGKGIATGIVETLLAEA
ncbi:MAG: GNAT family N-acetyltransferase, partial [Spirochaetaceae bacterium]|nr:GNAT family N-acetyltransferase [Spirochaetaceae bacterium]